MKNEIYESQRALRNLKKTRDRDKMYSLDRTNSKSDLYFAGKFYFSGGVDDKKDFHNPFLKQTTFGYTERLSTKKQSELKLKSIMSKSKMKVTIP